MKKRIFILVLALVLSLCCFSACGEEETPPKDDKFVNSTIYVPEKSGVGLYLTQYGTNERVKANYGKVDNLSTYFDKTKPTMVFFHGLQTGEGYKTDENQESWYPYNQIDEGLSQYLFDYWRDAGYNVVCFYYSKFACDSPDAVSFKIWTTTSQYGMRWYYEDENGNKSAEPETEDVPSVCLAQVFAHEYAALFNGYSGGEIRFIGHSMGGQMVVAAAGMVQTLQAKGEIDAALVPSRVTMVDPHIDDILGDSTLTSPVTETSFDSSYNQVMTVVEKLRSIGVAVEYMDGQIGGNSVLAALCVNGAKKEALVKQCSYILYDGSYFEKTSLYGTWHSVVRQLYLYSIGEPPVAVDEDANIYSVSAALPTTAAAAYTGNYYEMDLTDTFTLADDYVELVTARNGGTVFGYAFIDSNGDGLKNESFIQRKANVTVELKAEDGTTVKSTVTNSYGEYRFDGVEAGSYYVQFVTSDTVTTKNAEDGGQLINSNVDSTGKSDVFSIPVGGYVYVNMGVK